MAKVEGKKANTQAGCASCDFRRDDGSLHQSAGGYETGQKDRIQEPGLRNKSSTGICDWLAQGQARERKETGPQLSGSSR